MVRCASKFIGFFCLATSLAFADDRIYGVSENERLWNTPPELTPERAEGKSNLDNDSIQPRFAPFSASFTLSSGGPANNAHSLSVGGGEDGISFSQSASQAGSSFGNVGSGISASQSSSFAAGLAGISSSDSSSFSLNHPTYGMNSEANGNSFALGQATSSSHGNVVNGQASSGAQSAVGSSHSSAISGTGSGTGVLASSGQNYRQDRPTWTNIGPNNQAGGLYNPNGGRPKLHVTQGTRDWVQRPPGRGPLRLDVGINDGRWQNRHPEVFISDQRPNSYRGHRQNGDYHSFDNLQSESQENWSSDEGSSSGHGESWTQNPLTGPHPGTWSQSPVNQKPGLQIFGASASSLSTSNSSGGSAQGHSSSHSGLGPNGPFTSTNNRVQSTGNAQSNAHGSAAAIGQHFHGSTQGSFSSGAISANSQGNGNSHGSSVSGSHGQSSQGQVTSQSTGSSFLQGTANSGTFSYVKFPGSENPENIPKEFLRIRTSPSSRNNQPATNVPTGNPVGDFFTEITDAVADVLDI